MRALVVCLALLAGLKIWAHHALYVTATEQALLDAYRKNAVMACSGTAMTRQRPIAVSRSAGKVDWSHYHSLRVVIGDESVNVSLWQLDHEQWDQRYKTPFIHVVADGGGTRHQCIYNISTGHVSYNQV